MDKLSLANQMVEWNSSTASQLLHSPFYAVDIRKGDLIKARIKTLNGKQMDLPVTVWKYSPFGIDIVAIDTLDLSVNARLTLEFELGSNTSTTHAVVIGKSSKNLIGIRMFWSESQEDTWTGVERRVRPRFQCVPEYYPTAIALNPVIFNDYLYFRVIDYSETGMTLSCSLRNKFIVPGMTLDLNISIPFFGSCCEKVEVVSMRVAQVLGKDVLLIGVKQCAPVADTKRIFAQFLLQFGRNVDIEATKHLFGNVKIKFGRAIKFSFVRTEDDYAKVTELRSLAYKSSGKLAQDVDSAVMADTYDSKSRIIMGEYNGEIVTTARVVFSEPGETLAHADYHALPKWLPRNDQIVEINRLCINPKYQHTDIFFNLVRFLCITVMQSGRPYILCSADEKLARYYKRIGFQSIGIKYSSALMGNISHEMLLGHIPSGLVGRGVGLLSWCFVWSEISEYVKKYNVANWSSMDLLRLRVYRLLKPIIILLYKNRLK